MRGLPRGIGKSGDIPRGEGHGVSSHKYELSEEILRGLTMKEKQAVTKQLALSHKRGRKKEKGKILDTAIQLELQGHTLSQAAL